MCGIVGYIGTQSAVDIIVEGLTRLEYRGYDSAGLCLKDKEQNLVQYKKAGKIENLKNVLEGEGDSILKATMAIGHTRWATHGGVTDFNAHPHGNELINVVHNGIIENATELRQELEAEGYKFHSETDSEVFLILTTKYKEQGMNLFKAVQTAFKQIQGNSAFVVMERDSTVMVAVKRGAPLVCGTNNKTKELFVSSDPYALVGYADELYFPEDEVFVCFNEDRKKMIRFYDIEGNVSTLYLKQKQSMDLEISDKGSFDHYMIKEIHEQPDLIDSFMNFYFHGSGKESLEKVASFDAKRIHIAACGTAWHAGLVIKNFIEKFIRITCTVDLASEFRYRDPLIFKSDVGLFISQSGETADTLAAQELCKEAGLPCISIVNTEGSTIYRNCDLNLLIKAGTEVGVASTKAFTLQCLTGYLASRRLETNDVSSYKPQFELLSERIKELISREGEIKRIAHAIYRKKGFLYTGRGTLYPIALEGALKLKEIAYVHAEGYAAGELKHGPIALIDENMVNIALVGPELYEKTRSNIEEVKARKGVIVTIGPKGDEGLEKISDFYFGVDFVGLEDLSPLLVNVFNQLLSYYIAREKGTDIDKPRNLAKSVTVE